MNKPPPGLASAYATLTPLSIPQHWSPEQALAVWAFFDQITRQVWERYELSITELIGPDAEESLSQADLFDNQDIPF